MSDQLMHEAGRRTHQWRGVIEEYRDRLPVSDATPVFTLREGGTALIAKRYPFYPLFTAKELLKNA